MKTHISASPAQAASKSINQGKLSISIVCCFIAMVSAFGITGCGPVKPSKNSIEGAVAINFEKMGFKILKYSETKSENIIIVNAEEVHAIVTATPLQNLYEHVDTASYIKNELKFNPGTSSKIAAILSSSGAKRLIDTANISAQNMIDIKDIILVRKIASPNDSYVLNIGFLAGKGPSGWGIDELSIENITPKLPKYEIGLTQDNHHYNIDDPKDVEKLRALLSQNDSMLDALQKAAQTLLDQAIAQFAPGAIFTGTLTGNANMLSAVGENRSSFSYPFEAEHKPLSVSMQVVENNTASKTVSVLLRTKNSWSDTRSAVGVFGIDPISFLPVLTLDSNSDAALKKTGPIISDMNPLHILLVVKGDTLTAKAKQDTVLNLVRVPDADQDATIAKLKEHEDALRKSIVENAVFIFSIILSDSAPPEKYLLHIGKVSSDGSFDAVLKSSHNSLTRHFTGNFYTNPYRGNGFDLRIVSNTWDEKAREDPVLGTPYAISFAFQQTDKGFNGRDEAAGWIRWCSLTPANAAVAK